MKVSIFQPTYLPWLGFFKAIDWADKFVFLDDVQYESHSWQSRNRIKSVNGELILSVPIIRNFPQNINEVKINYAKDWTKSHLKSIEQNYSKTRKLQEFFPRLNRILNSQPEKLLDLNVSIINEICNLLAIECEMYFSSEFGVNKLQKNDKLLAILDKLGADKYLYAEGAAEYMKPAFEDYVKNNISLTPLKFEFPKYKQLYGDFISHLSIIDIIFNCGLDGTKKIINDIKLN